MSYKGISKDEAATVVPTILLIHKDVQIAEINSYKPMLKRILKDKRYGEEKKARARKALRMINKLPKPVIFGEKRD